MDSLLQSLARYSIIIPITPGDRTLVLVREVMYAVIIIMCQIFFNDILP